MNMFSKKHLNSLLSKVELLLDDVALKEKEHQHLLQEIHPLHAASARNLLHYLALRTQDLRHLQKELSALAISSQSHSEAYVLHNLQKIAYLLDALMGVPHKASSFEQPDQEGSGKILARNSDSLFGKALFPGQSKIMVTLPVEAAWDYSLVSNMVKAGMHIARINTAHDDEIVWEQMIANVHRAARVHRRRLKVYMDLAGPKVRTVLNKSSKDKDIEKDSKKGIRLKKGDQLKIFRGQAVGVKDKMAMSLMPEKIFEFIRVNEHVWFDDGKLGGFIAEINDEHILVEITHASEKGVKLKDQKGINFPGSAIQIPAITAEDLSHLPFIAKHANLIGVSFIQKPEDIAVLQQCLKELDSENTGIILKIETNVAFNQLPGLLFQAMKSPQCGVMIARGDLAIEIGHARMAEVQEEILWMVEAAHMPVIWATQVLETQLKKGMATRAEISDVVKSVRAECVMLNKGPFILDAIATVRDIDKRMAAHEDKKWKTLRSLQVAKTFFTSKG